MAKTEIMDLTIACESFPGLPFPEIRREHLLDTIETIFTGDTRVISLEGAEGIGKTTLLAQFATRHPQQALSLFIRPTSRWSYDPGVLLHDLGNQLRWILYRQELDSMAAVDDAFLRTHYIELRKRARSRREAIYFLVDGLDETSEPIRASIVDMLPFDMLTGHLPGFRFILTGDSKQLSASIPSKIPMKTFPLSPFTLDETKRFLSDLVTEQDTLNEIHSSCKGNPGYLASIRRILGSGTSVQILIEQMPRKVPELFMLEWSKVRSHDEKQQRLLAILAYAPRRHSVDDLRQILNLEAPAIEALYRDLGFVIVDPADQTLRFISEAFRKFAAEQLRHLKDQVHDLLIAHLEHEPHSDAALTYLPGYFEERKRFDDLLAYLSPDHFVKLLERNQSLTPLQQKADLGVQTALQLGQDGALLRFSAQKSAVLELAGAEIWRSEVEARMALNDYDAALALAQATPLKEDRLHLLAVIARAKRKQGLTPEPELLDQIHQLYHQLDQATLGERGIEIAADLIYSDPTLANELVEKTTNAKAGDSTLDWALARLSIAALGTKAEHLQSADSLESLRARIKDPKARQLSTSAFLLTAGYSAAQIIAEVEKLENTEARLFLLSQWTLNNRERDDAITVMDYSLTLAIKTTTYTPNARVLRELASPLPFVSDESAARRLIGSFDSQKGTIEHLGPTEDVVRLALLLAQAESKYDVDSARNRVVDTYFYISTIDDLAIKSGCLAWLVASLADIDPDLHFEAKEGIHGLAEADLRTYIDQLLNATAEHFQATRRIIRALAKTKPDMALEVALALNTEPVRDAAFSELVESALGGTPGKANLGYVDQVINRCADLELRDIAVLEVMEWLSKTGTTDWDSLLAAALPIINRIKDIHDPGARSKACCLAYSVLIKYGADKYSSLASWLLDLLRRSWEAIDVRWHKIDIGFKIVESLAESSLDKAKEFLSLTEKARNEIMLDASAPAETYITFLRLAIRAYSGLLQGNLIKANDTDSLATLIDILPSSGEKAELWAALAMHCYVSKQLHEGNRIVDQHIRPLLNDISQEDARYRANVIVRVAPAMYYAHQLTAVEQISQLSQLKADEAYAEICKFIFTKQPFYDPYESLHGHGYDVTYEEIVSICDLLGRMDSDVLIYDYIEQVADTLVARHRKDRFSQQQKADIATRLERITASKLPNPRYIKHDGYKLAAQAQLCRIKNSTPQDWENLAGAARIIPNLADKALVLAYIAVALPPKEIARRKAFLEECKTIIAQIPADLDKMSRYEDLASMVLDLDPEGCKEYLNLAMQAALGKTNSDFYRIQRRVIDIAYRINPQLATSLVAMVDDDLARSRLKERLQLLELREKMASQAMQIAELKSSSRQSECPDAAWMLLGSLNAGRIGTFHPEQIRDFLPIAANLPISESYPILAWIVENAKKRFANTDYAKIYLRSLYEAMLAAAELVNRMALRSSAQLKQNKYPSIRKSGSSSILIRPGERDGAIQFIKNWIEQEVPQHLKICDPYFGPDDLEILQLLRSINPDCSVYILTSKEHQDREKVSAPWEDAYRTHWRVKISDQAPPDTEIFIIGTASRGELPIHDRWLLSERGGLSLGTSFNGLGFRDSVISIIPLEDLEVLHQNVDQYLHRMKRDHRGEKLLYTIFTL